MPVYTYTARDQRGQTSTGSLEAHSDSNAAAQLRERGLWVTELRPARGGRPEAPSAEAPPRREQGLDKRLRSPVSPRDLSLFYRQLHTLLHSGVSIMNALEMLSGRTQSPNAQLRRVVAALYQQVLQGGRISEAMARFPWLFDRLQLRMVEAGEAGGFLADVFRRLAEYLEREFELRQQIKRKTLYPKLVLTLLVLVLPIQSPLNVKAYLAGLTGLLTTIALIGIPGWFLARLLLTSEGLRDLVDHIKLAVPVTGGVARKLAAARFARSLAALYGAGVPIPSAFAMSAEACGSGVLERGALRRVGDLERGSALSTILGETRFFPPMFLGMVSTGETTGNLDVMLDKAADFYEEEANHATSQLVVVLGVGVLILVAIMVAIKVIGFYTGMLGGVMESVGGGGGGE